MTLYNWTHRPVIASPFSTPMKMSTIAHAKPARQGEGLCSKNKDSEEAPPASKNSRRLKPWDIDKHTTGPRMQNWIFNEINIGIQWCRHQTNQMLRSGASKIKQKINVVGSTIVSRRISHSRMSFGQSLRMLGTFKRTLWRSSRIFRRIRSPSTTHPHHKRKERIASLSTMRHHHKRKERIVSLSTLLHPTKKGAAEEARVGKRCSLKPMWNLTSNLNQLQ